MREMTEAKLPLASLFRPNGNEADVRFSLSLKLLALGSGWHERQCCVEACPAAQTSFIHCKTSYMTANEQERKRCGRTNYKFLFASQLSSEAKVGP